MRGQPHYRCSPCAHIGMAALAVAAPQESHCAHDDSLLLCLPKSVLVMCDCTLCVCVMCVQSHPPPHLRTHAHASECWRCCWVRAQCFFALPMRSQTPDLSG